MKFMINETKNYFIYHYPLFVSNTLNLWERYMNKTLFNLEFMFQLGKYIKPKHDKNNINYLKELWAMSIRTY